MENAMEKSKARRQRSMWIVIGSILGLLVLIGIGVGVGVGVSNANKNNSSSSSTSSPATGGGSGSGNGNGNGGGNGGGNSPGSSDPNDPSNFVRDPRLHRSFYGMAYTPEGSLMPNCGNSLENVIRDVQLLSQLTTRVRLYGADCNQSALVLEAIQRTNVEMEVFLGNYVLPDDPEVYTRQRDIIRDAISTYGTEHIAGVTVGNEFMLNYLNGGTDPNSALGEQGADMLIDYIEDTRAMLASLNLDKDIPVGNSDAGSYFNTRVLSSVDYGLSNVHAWFANTTAEGAAQWVFDFFDEENVQAANALPNRPRMYIAETGWPTASSDVSNANNGAAPASIAGLQTFLDTFVCQANSDGVGYFYFELFDEEWKDELYGGVEGHWGLFTKDRELKDVTIPDCASP
ncbi:hypothetical protein AX16_000966 [Volvariella volvacea WC 439]|nr:hypothetical protein AX16_000966 [Volvariella volvacea WC 439]